MTGNNELKINEATMIELVQEWFDSRIKEGMMRKQFVRSVKQDMTNMVFTIRIESEGE
jgi:hypothetical protein